MDYIKNRFAIPAVFLPCPARLAFGWCDSPAKVITNLCKSPLMSYRKSMHKAATSYRNLCINPTESAGTAKLSKRRQCAIESSENFYEQRLTIKLEKKGGVDSKRK